MTKDHTFNAYGIRAEFVRTDGDEVVIDLLLRRRAPKGARVPTSETRTRMRLTLSPWLVNQIAEVGGQGLRKLVQDAEDQVRGRQGYLERLKRIVGAA